MSELRLVLSIYFVLNIFRTFNVNHIKLINIFKAISRQ